MVAQAAGTATSAVGVEIHMVDVKVYSTRLDDDEGTASRTEALEALRRIEKGCTHLEEAVLPLC